eukprot:17396-Heterococcus_DN1.PRE.1
MFVASMLCIVCSQTLCNDNLRDAVRIVHNVGGAQFAVAQATSPSLVTICNCKHSAKSARICDGPCALLLTRMLCTALHASTQHCSSEVLFTPQQATALETELAPMTHRGNCSKQQSLLHQLLRCTRHNCSAWRLCGMLYQQTSQQQQPFVAHSVITVVKCSYTGPHR